VLVTAADGDAVSARAVTALHKVRDAFKGKSVPFMMLDSSLKSRRRCRTLRRATPPLKP
jgi:hypothetical protein